MLVSDMWITRIRAVRMAIFIRLEYSVELRREWYRK